MGRCHYLVHVAADILTRAVSQRFWSDRSARRAVLMSTLESQSEDVNSEVPDVGLANRNRSTSKAFYVDSALLPMIQSHGHRQDASEMLSFDPRLFDQKGKRRTKKKRAQREGRYPETARCFFFFFHKSLVSGNREAIEAKKTDFEHPRKEEEE